jgi:hypothetical protein
MAKKNMLEKGRELSSLRTTAGKGPVAVPQKEAPATVIVQAHFAPEVRDTLEGLRYKTKKNLRSLLGEAINLLADKYGVPQPFNEEA